MANLPTNRSSAKDIAAFLDAAAKTPALSQVKGRLIFAIDALASRIGFRVAPGFGDRVIFRELFPMGLTMLDLPQPGLNIPLSMSHVAARQEVRELVAALKLPEPMLKQAAG